MTSIYYSPETEKIILLKYSYYGIVFISDNSGARTIITENFARDSIIKNGYQLIGAFHEN
jgi:hypothetical protein